MRNTRMMLGVTPIVVVAIAGCGSSSHHSTRSTTASTTVPAASTTAGTSTTASAPSRVVVPMLVSRTKYTVEAFVKLTVKGRPYFFVVDTGAMKSLVDSTVAKALALPARGAATSGTSLCTVSLQPVAISGWKLGEATLPSTTVFSERTKLAGKKINGVPIAGSLGSDMLSRFGSVTLDVAGKRLILGSQPPSGGQTVPAKIGRALGEVVVYVPATIHGKPAFYEIDTGAGYTTIDSRAAKRLGLRAVGKSVKAGTTLCSASTSTPVRIDDWTGGRVKLPSTVAVSSHSAITDQTKGKVVGLLALNVLSTFGEVTIDFAGQRMVLGGKAS